MNEERTPQELVAEAMRFLANSEPPFGMERRIASQIHQAQALQAGSRTRRWQLALFASATLAATALCVFLVRPAARAPAPQQHGVFQPSIAELQPSAAVSPKPKQRARRIVSAPVQRHANIAEDQRSFPAPPQPLTEQERVLQRVVEQNQPETMKALKLIASNDGPEHVSIQPGEPR